MRGWQHSHSARMRDTAWKLKHGYSVLNPGKRISGRSPSGKIYLPSEPAKQPPQKPEADTGSAAASTLPSAAASSAKGNLSLFLALVVIASTWVCAASASPADARWLDAVALIESSNDSSATGDGGKARGMFQFHRDAWEVARGINPKVWEYTRGSTNAVQSRLAAAAYLTWLRQRFAANGVAMPTDAQLYAAYNCGFAGFKNKYRFDVAKTPRTTQRACAKLTAISQLSVTDNRKLKADSSKR